MKIAVGQLRSLDNEALAYAAQLGATGIQLNNPDLPGAERWEFMDLLNLRTRVEDAGLELFALENTPNSFFDKAMLGLPGRDEQIENYVETIRNLGRAGVPILGFHWMPNSVWRTSRTTPGRGGAQVTSFDMDLAADAPLSFDREYSADEMWANLEYFLKAVVPVAEEAGVKLAAHPDDPPVESLGGVARILKDRKGFERMLAIVDSPNLGLDFCMGCWSEMMGMQCLEAIRDLAGRDKIFYLHFRDVQGTAGKFQECFLGEGNVDVAEAIRTLRAAGFDGYLLDDHVPGIVNDAGYGYRARAHAIGYIQGLVAGTA